MWWVFSSDWVYKCSLNLDRNNTYSLLSLHIITPLYFPVWNVWLNTFRWRSPPVFHSRNHGTSGHSIIASRTWWIELLYCSELCDSWIIQPAQVKHFPRLSTAILGLNDALHFENYLLLAKSLIHTFVTLCGIHRNII